MIAIVMRTVILYIIVTVGIRLMGKRQIGDMQPNELVVTLLISEIAAIPLQDIDQPVLTGVVAIFVLVILEISVSILAMKSFFIRKLMSGQSVVIIKNGVIDQQAMRNVRMTVLDLVELLRGQEVFDLSTVAFAVLEVNGELSVLLKPKDRPATVGDLSLPLSDDGLPMPVITDGKIVDESLKALQISDKTVYRHLDDNRLKSEDVFLMMLDRNDNISIVKKERRKI